MKMDGNCRVCYVMDCPYLVWPRYHSGFTGKSGPETWWHCSHHGKPIRHIKKCEKADNAELWKKELSGPRKGVR